MARQDLACHSFGRNWYRPGVTEIHGHRGARALSPENTLPGLACALAIGVDAIEFDVTLTADDSLILAHDLTVDPVIIRDTKPVFPGDPMFPYTGKPWLSLTSQRVATLDAGHGGEPGGTVRVPTLDQVCTMITAAAATGVTLAVELKTNPSWPDADVHKLTQLVLGTIAAAGLTGQTRVLAFDWRVLRVAADIAPTVPRVALVEPSSWQPGSPWLAGLDPADYGLADDGLADDGLAGYGLADACAPGRDVPGCADAAHDAGAGWVSPSDRMTGPLLVQQAHRNGLRVAVWTVNEPARCAQLIALGADGIVTDRPDVLRQVLAGHGYPLPAPILPPSQLVHSLSWSTVSVGPHGLS